jgi:predicted outer membrane lipoprotein
MPDEDFGSAALRRVEWLTPTLGGCGTALAAWRWGWRGALGVAMGTLISWVNFRWLKGGVHAFGKTATEQTRPEAARVPKGALVKFIGRFALLLAAVYVILTRSWVPPVAFFAGLFASAAGVVTALVYELLSSGLKQSVGKGL